MEDLLLHLLLILVTLITLFLCQHKPHSREPIENKQACLWSVQLMKRIENGLADKH